MSLARDFVQQGNQQISIKSSLLRDSPTRTAMEGVGSNSNVDDQGNCSDLSDHTSTPRGVNDKSPIKGFGVLSLDETATSTISKSIVADESKTNDAVEPSCNSEDVDDFDDVPSRIAPQRAISNISVLSVNTNSNDGGGDSVCGGASVDGSYARSTRAESIRARMRRQEKRLSELVQKQASAELAGVDKYKHEMDDVKSNLDKVEQEKYALEQKLEFLKSQQTPEAAAAINVHDVTDHDAFLRDKLNGIQRGFQEQASKIQAFEGEIISKNAEIEKYRHEIVEKLKRIVELEFDLEMHDIHFTDYFSEHGVIGTDGAVVTVVDAESAQDGENPSGTGESAVDSTISLMNNGKKLTPKRAQKLIAKLLKDLDHLEATYKKEKLSTVRSEEHLKNENDELRTKILVLEQEQKVNEQSQKSSKNSSMSGLNDSGAGYMNIYRLRKRVETLEAKRFLYRKEFTSIKDEMAKLEKESSVKDRKYETEVSKLQLQLDAANARLKELEGDISTENDNVNAVYDEIEQKIEKTYQAVAKMQAGAEIKDKQIDALKKELQKLQIAKISVGEGGDKYSQSDIDTLKSANDTAVARTDNGDNHRNDVDAEDNKGDLAITNVSATFVADLQRQLLVAHEQLVKKDQELVIERAKSACMAANLLDRIAELDKEVEKVKRREQQNSSRRTPTSATSTPIHPDTQFDTSYISRSRNSDDRSTRSRTVTASDDASTRSTRSFMTTDGDNVDNKRKPRKTMASRIPFRFGVSKDGTP